MSEPIKVTEIFGEDVFNDTIMQERLPKKIYKELKRTIEEGKELDLATADVIARISGAMDMELSSADGSAFKPQIPIENIASYDIAEDRKSVV